MDGGVIVGYLVAYLTGKAKHLADRVVDELLERVYAKLASALRGDPSFRHLEDNPSDDQAQADVTQSLAAAVASNEQLTGELRQLIDELDRRGAQKLIVSAPVHGQVFQQVTAQNGSIVGSIGRDVNIYQDAEAKILTELSNAGRFVKLLTVLGIVSSLTGFGIILYSGFSWHPRLGDPNFGNFPPGIVLGFGLFFAGIVLMIITRMAVLLRRRR